ncbi:MAG: hypothetical protein D6725_06040, partial [Planctomycetota bacterium]
MRFPPRPLHSRRASASLRARRESPPIPQRASAERRSAGRRALPLALLAGLAAVLLLPRSAPARDTDTPAANASTWTPIDVPGPWEEAIPRLFTDYDGFAWYRCYVKVPDRWASANRDL